MTPSTRLRMSALMILLSAIYGVLIAQDPNTATAIALGYVAALLTAIILTNIWKKPQ